MGTAISIIPNALQSALAFPRMDFAMIQYMLRNHTEQLNPTIRNHRLSTLSSPKRFGRCRLKSATLFAGSGTSSRN
jgi:hypothetical protein